ncbi:macrolide family glycosyltransferase [Streptomyces sp. NBC_00103]|uniref:macrolide family glycosyltransferase n=1 Tax=Streptomyces sp. NBC_00103 TaxID=2975653 RepID=UPI002257DBB2|nr:macrolide family glycosyltransferase [Streptomyces sp. NBC_00103]MCX5369513.1 OleI family self-immunity macrolide glycosyltransferase [Streptomyces sp. NBC_00103]
MPGTHPNPAHIPAHIAVFNVPMHGHVNPTLGVVEELVRRGHRVSYAVTEDFVHQVKAAGAEPVLYPDPGDGSDAPEDMGEGFARVVEVALAALPALTRAFGRDRPDLVLCDIYAFAGLLLGARWQVPTVVASPTHLAYDGIVPEFFNVPGLPQLPGFARLAAAFADHGIEAARIQDLVRPEHAVAFFPRTFQRRADTVEAQRVAYVGPALGDRSYQGSWQPPRPDVPVLLVSLGSQFTRRPEFYRSCVQAFAELPWHVVMSVGAVPPDGLGPLPANVEVHPHVPQLAVLAHADAFVTHAGMGGTMEALHYGVPLVAVPQMAEQRVNAARIEHLRLGVHLPRESVTPEALREAVLRVSSDRDIRAGVSAMRREIAAAGGAAAAADLIEGAL